MNTDTVLIVGFVVIVIFLWKILLQLIDNNLRAERKLDELLNTSEQTNEHLREINEQLLEIKVGVENIPEFNLEEINDKLKDIESSVDGIRDEVLIDTVARTPKF
jgi:uncharacterized protein Yka (UPF0111/DUF47 family)